MAECETEWTDGVLVSNDVKRHHHPGVCLWLRNDELTPNSTRQTRTEPDQTRPDISGLRQSLRHVWFWLNSIIH